MKRLLNLLCFLPLALVGAKRNELDSALQTNNSNKKQVVLPRRHEVYEETQSRREGEGCQVFRLLGC